MIRILPSSNIPLVLCHPLTRAREGETPCILAGAAFVLGSINREFHVNNALGSMAQLVERSLSILRSLFYEYERSWVPFPPHPREIPTVAS